MNAQPPKIPSSNAKSNNLGRVKSSNSVSTLDSDELDWSINHINEEYPRCEVFDVNEFLESNEYLDILKTIEDSKVHSEATDGKQTLNAAAERQESEKVTFLDSRAIKVCSPSCSEPDDGTSENSTCKLIVAKKRKNKLCARASRRTKKPQGLPKRPLSAYNIFFKEERVRIFQESEKTNARISFEELGRMIGHRWQKLDEEGRKKYQELAEKDIARYQNEIVVFNKKICQKTTRRVSKSPISLGSNFEGCVSSSKPSSFVSERLIARTVTEDNSSFADPEASANSIGLPDAQAISTDNKESNHNVEDSSHQDCKEHLLKPSIIMKLPQVMTPYASYPLPDSQFMHCNCAASTEYPFNSSWAGADVCSKQSKPMITEFKEWVATPQYPGTGYDWRIISSRSPSYQHPSNGGTLFPPRGTVSFPDPKTKSERIYSIDYKCFRMTRKEFDAYLERCRKCSHEHGNAKMTIHNQILRAPTPPGIEVKDFMDEW